MAMSVPTRNSSKSDLNNFNIWLHAQPWWLQFIQSQGQNPSRIALSDAQRGQLQQIAARNGVDLSGLDGMNFDPSANLNTPHGFASQPSWLKATEIAAPIAAATMFGVPLTPFQGLLSSGAPNATAGTLGHLAVNGAIDSEGFDAAAGAASSVAPHIANASAPFFGGSFGDILKYGTGPISGMVTGIYGARTQANAANKAGELEANAAMHGADLTSAAAQKALEFQQQQEATRKAEWEKTQAQNLDFYNQAQARLTPYRNMGLGALMQMRRPLGA